MGEKREEMDPPSWGNYQSLRFIPGGDSVPNLDMYWISRFFLMFLDREKTLQIPTNCMFCSSWLLELKCLATTVIFFDLVS